MPSITDPVAVIPQTLPSEVVARRAVANERAKEHLEVLAGRVEAHLATQQSALDRLRQEHLRMVEETNFDPTARTQAAAMWLVAGRCLATCYALLALEHAGQADNADAIARAEHEAARLLSALSDSDEAALIEKFLADKWIRPKALLQAEKDNQTRVAEQMVRCGVVPPQRTEGLTTSLYRNLSEGTHHRHKDILEDYDDKLRTFRYGVEGDPVRQAAGCWIGTQIVCDTARAVGLALANLRGIACFEQVVEPILQSLQDVNSTHPLDPDHLPFAASEPDALVTQPVTGPDLEHGRIRIPITSPVKEMFPAGPTEIDMTLRGQRMCCSFNPRMGPDRERSGVINVGRDSLMRLVCEGEQLAVSRNADGLIVLG